MSLARTIRNIRTAGIKKAWRDLQYIGDVKAGTLIGTDTMGNKYYEDLSEIPGRTRWVDYANHDFATTQLEPLWHSWLHQIRDAAPNNDPIVAASRKAWEAPRPSFTFVSHSALEPGPLCPCDPIAILDLVSARSLFQCINEGWEHMDSTTGTRASYRAYSTVISPKIQAWEPTVKPRK